MSLFAHLKIQFVLKIWQVNYVNFILPFVHSEQFHACRILFGHFRIEVSTALYAKFMEEFEMLVQLSGK